MVEEEEEVQGESQGEGGVLVARGACSGVCVFSSRKLLRPQGFHTVPTEVALCFSRVLT